MTNDPVKALGSPEISRTEYGSRGKYQHGIVIETTCGYALGYHEVRDGPPGYDVYQLQWKSYGSEYPAGGKVKLNTKRFETLEQALVFARKNLIGPVWEG